MPRIPLEDNFVDVLSKAQRGLQLSDDQLAAKAGVAVADLAALLAGQVPEPALRAVGKALGLSEKALLALAKREWYPQQPIFPRGFAMFNTPYEDIAVNSYLVWDIRNRQAAAFDTGATAQPMLDLIQAERLTLRYVFVTHSHEDHIADLAPLLATGAELWSSELEPLANPGAKVFKENAHFHFGTLAVKTLLTSGHSPGQTTFFVTGLAWPLAIVGDSLFSSSIGGSRTHFAEQWRNDREKIFTLPTDTVIACGHGPLTTLKQEKAHNPFFAR